MADVRAQSGVPVAANFGGFLSPTPSTPIVIDLATGGAYFLGTGDVVTSIGKYISGNSQITGTLTIGPIADLVTSLLLSGSLTKITNVILIPNQGTFASVDSGGGNRGLLWLDNANPDVLHVRNNQRDVGGTLSIETKAGGGQSVLIDNAAAVTLLGHVAGTPTFTAGSKYLVVDASGHIQVSALGPAS